MLFARFVVILCDFLCGNPFRFYVVFVFVRMLSLRECILAADLPLMADGVQVAATSAVIIEPCLLEYPRVPASCFSCV